MHHLTIVVNESVPAQDPYAGVGDGYSGSVLRVKVPFFFKHWDGVHLCVRHWRRQKKRAGRTLEGRTWDEMPVNLVRV